MKKPYFSLDHLTVGYQGHAVVEDISIELAKGQILTLIGPNGAGKSTILKTIVGQLPVISGEIRIDQKNIADISRSELSRKMAVVLTEKIKTELMTCEEVVATGRFPYTGRFGRLSEDDYRVVEESMELVHVTQIRDKDFMRISDGQRQRVMLARAICQEPDIIILDEPTSFLDVKYKLEFLSVLQKLRSMKDLTVVMSIHELELAERVSDRILCVNGLKIDGYGSAEEIFRPGYITSLFGIHAGSFDESNTSMELKAPDRERQPDLFVLAGAGSARSVYGKLQRENTPFITGILYENDLDYPVASALAAQVISTPAFEPVSEDAMRQAQEAVNSCRKVICCRSEFGSLDTCSEQLLDYARSMNKEIDFLYADRYNGRK
ncbi:MAG: ABC transporter ATP-binding protein [Parasporobacterium sp.]|nr:ABC transporter ATP-binding protein [Parasporobacterium sp.]